MVSQAKTMCPPLDLGETSYVDDLTLAVPIFCKDGQQYKWQHKSLSEYFAANYLFKDAKKQLPTILRRIYDAPNIRRYSNLLDIYYDLDSASFREYILLPFFKEYIAYISRYNEDSPEYFLRNLLFLRDIRIMAVYDLQSLNEIQEYVDGNIDLFEGASFLHDAIDKKS